MKSLNYFLKPLLTVLLLITVAIGLLNTEYFYSPTAFAFYGFALATLFFIIAACFYSDNNKGIRFRKPTLLFGIWCFYVLIHHSTNTGTLVFMVYSIVLYFLLLKTTTLFSAFNFNFKPFFIGIAFIASLESIYCIAQFLGWISSQNDLYIVTGSWNNPNVTAIFLALTTPVFLFLCKDKFKKVILSGFLIMLIALLLLKCRAAFIGTVLSTLFFYGLEYDVLSWIKNKKNRTSLKAISILILLIITPISFHLYNAKRASAEGRKFIWNLSVQMATEKPLMGYGYGFFEKEYNIFQANYIKNGKATIEELTNAGPVIMPHNELLLNVVEGGIIGLILMILFFASLLLAIKKRKKTISDKLAVENPTNMTNRVFNLGYAGIIAFIAMSMVNSTVQIVPIMCLLIIYASIICSTLEPIQLLPNFYFFQKNPSISFLSKAIIISTSVFLLYICFEMATADHLNKKAALLQKEKQYEKALQIMPVLEKSIGSYSDYWKNYGTIYLGMKQYSKALECLEKAKKRSSLPELYNGSGFCYYQLQQYPQAIKEYETLTALHPTKFLYRMTLLQTYLKNKDIPKAIDLAQEIIGMKPKIPSDKVDYYKNRCHALLKKLGVQKITRKQLLFQKQRQLIKKQNT